MIKKILPVALCLMLVFGISCSAANSTDGTDAPAVPEEMPMPGGGDMRGGMGAPQRKNTGTEERPDMTESGITPPQRNDENAEQTQPANGENLFDTGTANEKEALMQGGDMGGGMPGAEAAKGGILDFLEAYSTPITAVVLLMLAFVFVVFYKRKQY